MVCWCFVDIVLEFDIMQSTLRQGQGDYSKVEVDGKGCCDTTVTSESSEVEETSSTEVTDKKSTSISSRRDTLPPEKSTFSKRDKLNQYSTSSSASSAKGTPNTQIATKVTVHNTSPTKARQNRKGEPVAESTAAPGTPANSQRNRVTSFGQNQSGEVIIGDSSEV